jgi:hypothetical protein
LLQSSGAKSRAAFLSLLIAKLQRGCGGSRALIHGFAGDACASLLSSGKHLHTSDYFASLPVGDPADESLQKIDGSLQQLDQSDSDSNEELFQEFHEIAVAKPNAAYQRDRVPGG